MPGNLRIEWISAPAKVGRRAILAVFAAILMTGVGASLWLVKSIRLAEMQAQPVPRNVNDTRPALSEDEKLALREEIAAVNRPVRQLNQQWDVLLAELQPTSPAVRLLEIDVDAVATRVRIVGRSRALGDAVDFAALLATRRELAEVVFSRHELEEGENPAYRFVVEARWDSGR